MKRRLWICLVVSLAYACHRDKDAAGPMERAGRDVDHAAKKAGEAVETAADKTGAAADKAVDATGSALQKAGKKLKGDEPEANKK